MMKPTRKNVILAVSTAFIAGLTAQSVWAESASTTLQAVVAPFHWKLNGQTFSSDDWYDNGDAQVPSSLNYEGTAYVPLRLLSEQLGLEVTWNQETQTAELAPGGAEDDPSSDFPLGAAASAGYRVMARLTAGTESLRSSADAAAAALLTLNRDRSLQVLQEAAGGWLQVRTSDGHTGYVPVGSTDYVPEAKRPAWEQTADGIIARGLSFLGTPYKFGAALGQTATFDCSSFTNYLYGQAGIKLPRDSRQQSAVGNQVSVDSLRKGDLVFFTTPARKDKTGTSRIGHVAIYLGNGQLLHTYRVGIGVTVTDLDENWRARIVKAMRIIS